MDWLEESDLVTSATEWVAKVTAAHSQGDYETWPVSTPIDEMSYLLDFRREALAKIDLLHQRLAHLGRIVEANPGMRIADALAAIDRSSSGE